jgi:hypothetical protein
MPLLAHFRLRDATVLFQSRVTGNRDGTVRRDLWLVRAHRTG